MKKGQAWFFGMFFLFFAVFFFFALAPGMLNIINAQQGLVPDSTIAFGGLAFVFALIGIMIIFWKIISPGGN